MQTDPEAIARQYRREAEHLRHAVEMIEKARLREQLRALGVGNGLVAKVRGGTV